MKNCIEILYTRVCAGVMRLCVYESFKSFIWVNELPPNFSQFKNINKNFKITSILRKAIHFFWWKHDQRRQQRINRNLRKKRKTETWRIQRKMVTRTKTKRKSFAFKKNVPTRHDFKHAHRWIFSPSII